MEIYLKVFIYREKNFTSYSRENIKRNQNLESADSLCSVVVICSTV